MHDKRDHGQQVPGTPDLPPPPQELPPQPAPPQELPPVQQPDLQPTTPKELPPDCRRERDPIPALALGQSGRKGTATINRRPSAYGRHDRRLPQDVVPNQQIISGPTPGTYNVVYVATQGNTVYAINAANGAILLSRISSDDDIPNCRNRSFRAYVTLFRTAPISVCEKALRVWVR